MDGDFLFAYGGGREGVGHYSTLLFVGWVVKGCIEDINGREGGQRAGF